MSNHSLLEIVERALMNKSDGERLGKVLTNLKRSWSKGTCLHPLAPTDCNGKPVNSHTVQRSRVLEAIASDGHVLKIRVDPAAVLKAGLSMDSLGHPLLDLLASLKSVDAFTPERIGVSNASVFPGFCGKHDHDTFAPVEEHELIFNNKQCFLLTYRPACMELWAQRSKAQTLKTAFDQEEDSDFLKTIREDGEIALAENILRKADLDLILRSGDSSMIHALVLTFDSNPGVATAGVFAPEGDFADSQLQDLGDVETPLQYVSYSIIPSVIGGHAIIGWHDRDTVINQFISSLLSLNSIELPNALLRVAFESLENTYFSPLWWNKLSATQKNWVGLRAILGGTTSQQISYKPDGIHLATFGASVSRHY